jgi:hypothetical protein
VVDEEEVLLRWSDHTLKGQANEYATGAPVRLFVMGDNVWRDEQEFPPARARATRYYLHSTKGAATAAGDGALSTVAPRNEPPDRFTYDPADPVPTLGGRLCCGATYLPGPADQRANESRADVLVYSTPPLAQDVEVTGFVTAEIQAATSAADTDFTALLVDVDPSGYARYLADGIVRGRYRKSTERAEPIQPGRIETYAIDLGATSNVFKAGHRIRLYISSSNFPRFDRNLNTGEPLAQATRMVKAEQGPSITTVCALRSSSFPSCPGGTGEITDRAAPMAPARSPSSAGTTRTPRPRGRHSTASRKPASGSKSAGPARAMPPPRITTSGSSALTMEATAQARRWTERSQTAVASASPARCAATRSRVSWKRPPERSPTV